MNTDTPGIGHNSPPDPIDTITGSYTTDREESENWTDGTPVENETQMNDVDALRKAMRQCRLDLEAGQKDATKPLNDALVAERNRWKPTIEDAKRIEGCLVSTVNTFKQKLAAEQAEAERKAWEETNRLRRESEAKASAADAADLDAQREAAAAKQAVIDAENAAKAIAKDAPKGMRKTTHHEVTDMRALVNWIATNDKDAMADFATEYARKNHKATPMTGVRVWETKEAY